MENRALGKGLSALIPEKIDSTEGESIKYLKLTEIRENNQQPRIEFDRGGLSELIASIKEKGVLQPILVRKRDDGYEIIAGERRFRAARELNLEKIPVIIKSVSDREALVLALIENIQREELNAIEEAKAFKRLIEDFNLTQDDVAQSVGKNRSTVTNVLRLLRLPEEIQKSIKDGIFSVGHARTLLSVEDLEEQRRLFVKSTQKGLSVRELENLIKARVTRISHQKRTSPHRQQDIFVASIEEDLQKLLGTKVRIQTKQKRGSIIIEFYSSEDLNRILNIIKEGNG